jgi:transcriptional regulator with XRE-family HTH domain
MTGRKAGSTGFPNIGYSQSVATSTAGRPRPKEDAMARPTGSRGTRAATLSDVAKLAGVSVSTASKALNGRNHVHSQTRERVFEAAAQLHALATRAAR